MLLRTFINTSRRPLVTSTSLLRTPAIFPTVPFSQSVYTSIRPFFTL